MSVSMYSDSANENVLAMLFWCNAKQFGQPGYCLFCNIFGPDDMQIWKSNQMAFINCQPQAKSKAKALPGRLYIHTK